MLRNLCLALIPLLLPTLASAACLNVGDDQAIALSQSQTDNLAKVGFTRSDLFTSLASTAEFETLGCWAAPVGNFDAQTLSVGVLQWNYGQNSLQPLMQEFRASFDSPEAFDGEVRALMPLFGTLAFSEACSAIPIAQTCKDQILAAHGSDGRLGPQIAGEYEALFNSPRMRQVQVGKFIAFLDNLAPKLTDMFGPTPTRLQTRWGVDLAIQQGYVRYLDATTGTDAFAFLNPTDAASVRRLAEALSPDMRRQRMMSALRWYSGLCGGIYQGVVAQQCNYNITHWCAVVQRGVTDEQFDLFNLTFVRSRIATGQSGRWQANAFARRTKIVLGTGQVGPNKLPLPQGVRRTRKCKNLLIPTAT